MANAITADKRTVYGTIDTNGTDTVAIVALAAHLVDLSLNFAVPSAAAFVGTVRVQRKTRTGVAGAPFWGTVETHTAAIEKVLRNSVGREMRLSVDVTSGVLGFELTAGEKG